MADGISTRLQRDMMHQQQELERIEAKIDGGLLQLRNEIEKMGTEMRSMFEQLMSREIGKNQGATMGDSSSNSKAVPLPDVVEAGELIDGDSSRFCKHRRLDCPRFDGENFTGWLMKLEQFFEAERIPVEAKVRTVMMQLEGRALQWHQHYVRSQGSPLSLAWTPYLDDMRRRFGDSEYSDPMSEVVALKQHGTVDDYYDEFLSLLNALQLSSDYSLSIFISNLKPEISKMVRLFYPKTLSHAFCLAKQLESLYYIAPRRTFTPYKNPPQALSNSFSALPNTPKPSHLPPLLPTPNIPMLPAPQNPIKPSFNPTQKPNSWTPSPQYPRGNHLPTKQEKDERRKNGLCIWCGVKFFRGHQCIKSQLYQLLVDFSIEGDEDTDLFLDCEDSTDVVASAPNEENNPVISLHALTGTTAYQTMRVQGKIKNQLISILVDTGSTHNFVDQQAIKRTGARLHDVPSFIVTVANGDKLQVQKGCSDLIWEVQGCQQSADFFVLPLRGCEMVLGVQWLITLGPILWNFKELTMKFTWEAREVVWHGQVDGQVVIMSQKQASKVQGGKSKGAYTMLLTGCAQGQLSPKSELEITKGTLPLDIQLLLDMYSMIFQAPAGLPPRRSHDHRIPLTDETQTIKIRPYRYPAMQKNELEKLIEEMLASGVIRDSFSSFASPVVLVKKKDGTWRLCVDYRQLNKLTVKDKFPIPLVEELLDELAKAVYFSKLDLRSGYHQIRMHEDDIQKTAFRTHQGHYEFLVMPFGLTNAPSTFQSLMNTIFKPYLRHFVLVFFDDILIYSEDWSSHLVHLQTVFEVLKQNKLFVKLSKCVFGSTVVEYLGHVIHHGEVSMDASKITSVLNWPIPKSVKEVRGFLGLTGYYRKFIKGYGSLARPLTDLLKKGTFQWTLSSQQAFDDLKHVMVSAPVLVLPNFFEEFTVESDASHCGLGAVLTQQGRPLAYFSKALSAKHQTLSVYEKEMMAILVAVKK